MLKNFKPNSSGGSPIGRTPTTSRTQTGQKRTLVEINGSDSEGGLDCDLEMPKKPYYRHGYNRAPKTPKHRKVVIATNQESEPSNSSNSHVWQYFKTGLVQNQGAAGKKVCFSIFFPSNSE
jgi:hypothetical protein